MYIVQTACRYERMGNCLAMQYGGSQAHSQYFHRQRGDWNAKVQSRDLVTTLTRIYNNNLNDAEKQQAMNLFLGNFVPQPGKPAVWELGSDKHLHAGEDVLIEFAPRTCAFYESSGGRA